VVLYTDEEDMKMPRKGHTEDQIFQALRQAEGGEKARRSAGSGGPANRPATPGNESIRVCD